MIRSVFVFVLLASLAMNAIGQAEDAKTLYANAKTFIRQGDYNNALVILNNLLQKQPDNLEVLKDVAFTHYLKKDYARALEVARPFPARPDVDVQAYQILGLIYRALEENKDGEKMYRAAVKKFPESGALQNELGELLWDKKDYSQAVRVWENGIKADPNYSGNYYNAAKYYYFSADKVWGLIYGETFVNLESYSARTEEIKLLLLEGYKKLFTDADLRKGQNTNNAFVNAYLGLMQKNVAAVRNGITPASISDLRTFFIVDWNKMYAPRFPFRLFEHQVQLVNMKLFDAYNQWLFTSAKDTTAYQAWGVAHADQQKEFIRLQQNRVFKIPAGQYYQSASK